VANYLMFLDVDKLWISCRKLDRFYKKIKKIII